MPQFIKNTPVETTSATIEVTVNPTNPLPIGKHKFQLVVVDDSGNISQPAVTEVVVADKTKPTAVIDAPNTVEAGKSFQLSGANSIDLPPGKIIKYIFTLL
jgi:hypothetical protein